MSLPPADDRLRTLLHVPPETSTDDLFESVFVCFVDDLGCAMISPRRLTESESVFLSGWFGRDGTRYEGRGASGREAAFAGALEFVTKAPEAAELRVLLGNACAFAA